MFSAGVSQTVGSFAKNPKQHSYSGQYDVYPAFIVHSNDKLECQKLAKKHIETLLFRRWVISRRQIV